MRKTRPLIRSPSGTPQGTTSCCAPTSATDVGEPRLILIDSLQPPASWDPSTAAEENVQ